MEAADTALLSSFYAAQVIGLQSVALANEDLFVAADTACTAVLQGLERHLDEVIASQDSSSTIDLGAASAEDASGALSAVL